MWLEYVVCFMELLDLESMGGDFFDLVEIGVSSVWYVCICDLGMMDDFVKSSALFVGFDLDVVGVVYLVL